MISDSFSLIVVIPVFEDRTSCGRLLSEILGRYGAEIFVVLVDDGSVQDPIQVDDIERKGGSGVVLRLSRNVGHQMAIACGLTYVSARMHEHQAVVVMDSDGEDSPDSIPLLLNKLGDNVSAVVAARGSRHTPVNFKVFYIFYKFIFRLMTGKKISFGNFMALTRAGARRLVNMRETGVHVAGSLLASRLKFEFCRIDREKRYHGESKMNFVSLALHGFKALMIFGEDVLVRTGVFCVLTALLSLFGIMFAILLKTFGFATPGWFSVAMGVLLVILLQTAVLALITLLMTGMLRSGVSFKPSLYTDLIREEISTSD